MILYDPTISVSLNEFGIQIPIQDGRATKSLEALQRHPRFGAAPFCHIDRIDQRLTRQDLLRAHTTDYVSDLYSGSERLKRIIANTYELIDADGDYHRYDPRHATRPLTDLFDRMLMIAAGTALCGKLALAHGFCYYFSGGMHHAHPDHGSGFCLINDIVIAARKLQAEKGLGTIWIIDTDAHKGDGTAAITAGDDSLISLSIHMASGWPLDGPKLFSDGRENPAFTPSDIDIPIEAGEESSYLERLRHGLDQLAASTPADLALVVSGADPYEGDDLPSTSKLNLNLEQLLARDRMVYQFLKNKRVPAAFLMAGGYGDAVWRVYAQFLDWVMSGDGGNL